MEMEIRDIPITKIIVRENVRAKSGDTEIRQLMQTIKQDGLQSPIGVNSNNGQGNYMLMYGSRRLLACKKLGWATVPARVYDIKDLSDFLVANLVENLHRKDVTPIELGRICVHLEKKNLTVGEIAARLSKPQSQIQNALTLYKMLPENFRDKVKYFGAGREQKKGTIAAHTATNVIRIAQTAGLSRAETGHLMEATRKNELSSIEIDNLAKLMATGLTVKQALKKNSEYCTVKVTVTCKISDLEKACKENDLGRGDVVRAAVYGLLPNPIPRPNFIDITPIHAKSKRKSKSRKAETE